MDDALASPPIGGTRALLLAHAPSLVPSERRVVQACIDEPERVAALSVAELARFTETSPATVVRACQRVGFGGFQRLKEHLLRDVGAAIRQEIILQDPRAAADETAEGAADGGHLVERVFRRAGEGILGVLGSLDLDVFDLAGAAIRDCRRLVIVGNGASLPPAQMAALHFLSAGRVCEAPVDVVTQHIAARLLRPGDVCLAVSDSGMNPFTLRAARLAAEGGATVVAITSYAKSELAEASTHALVAGAEFHTWNDDTLVGNIAQMLLLSALHQAAFSADPLAEAARAEVLDEVQEFMNHGSRGVVATSS